MARKIALEMGKKSGRCWKGSVESDFLMKPHKVAWPYMKEGTIEMPNSSHDVHLFQGLGEGELMSIFSHSDGEPLTFGLILMV